MNERVTFRACGSTKPEGQRGRSWAASETFVKWDFGPHEKDYCSAILRIGIESFAFTSQPVELARYLLYLSKLTVGPTGPTNTRVVEILCKFCTTP